MGFVSPYFVVFLKEKVFTITSIPQVWRLITPFLLTGPKLGLLMDPYFLYTYGSQLEMEASRFTQPGDFAVYIAFVAAVILVCSA
jgi:Derlin-2/3